MKLEDLYKLREKTIKKAEEYNNNKILTHEFVSSGLIPDIIAGTTWTGIAVATAYAGANLTTLALSATASMPLAVQMAAASGTCFALPVATIYKLAETVEIKKSIQNIGRRCSDMFAKKQDENEKKADFLLQAEAAIKRGYIKEYLTDKEVDRYRNNPKYLVLDFAKIKGMNTDFANKTYYQENPLSPTDGKYGILLNDVRASDEQSEAVLFIESGMLAGNDKFLVIEKESAVMRTVLVNRNQDDSLKTVLAEETKFANRLNSMSLSEIERSVHAVSDYKEKSGELMTKASEKAGLQTIVTIPAEQVKNCTHCSKSGFVVDRGLGEWTVVGGNDGIITENKDGSVTVRINNPFTSKRDKAELEDWRDNCNIRHDVDCMELNMRDLCRCTEGILWSHFDCEADINRVKIIDGIQLENGKDWKTEKMENRKTVTFRLYDENSAEAGFAVSVPVVAIKQSENPMVIEMVRPGFPLKIKSLDNDLSFTVKNPQELALGAYKPHSLHLWEGKTYLEAAVPKKNILYSRGANDSEYPDKLIFKNMNTKHEAALHCKIMETVKNKNNETETYYIQYPPFQKVPIKVLGQSETLDAVFTVYNNDTLQKLVSMNQDNDRIVSVNQLRTLGSERNVQIKLSHDGNSR